MLHPDPISSWVDQKGFDHAGPVLACSGEFKVIECACCQFKHVIPLPSTESLESVYANEYYTQEKPLYIERYLEDKTWWDAVYKERYESLEKFLGGRTGSILDVGSGPGLFLSLGRERGWEVKGIEPSKKAADYSQRELGLDIESIFLDECTASSLGQYDVVHMGEVLEHLPDPAGMLRIARGLLKPSGLLVLIVPNDFNPLQLILRDHLGFEPWWVAPPHHLNYFSHASLEELVKRQGFGVVRSESTFPIDMFLLMGKNYIGHETVGREVQGMRKAFDLALLAEGSSQLRSELYASLSRLGLGREIVLIAKSNGKL